MPQHDQQQPAGVDQIEAIRGPVRRMADRFPGVEPIDIALGAVYASHDLATRAGMTPHQAIEWLRTAADVMERQLMSATRQ